MPSKKRKQRKTAPQRRRARSASVTSHTPKGTLPLLPFPIFARLLRGPIPPHIHTFTLEPADMYEDPDGGLPIEEEGKKLTEDAKEADEDNDAKTKCAHIKSVKIKKIKAMLPHMKKEPKCVVGGLGWEDRILLCFRQWVDNRVALPTVHVILQTLTGFPRMFSIYAISDMRQAAQPLHTLPQLHLHDTFPHHCQYHTTQRYNRCRPPNFSLLAVDVLDVRANKLWPHGESARATTL